MENFILSKYYASDDEYFLHLRTNSMGHPENYEYHSVLLSGIKFLPSKNEENKKQYMPTIKVNVLDPAAQYTQKDIYQIGRADAFRLTEYGKTYRRTQKLFSTYKYSSRSYNAYRTGGKTYVQ